MADRAMEGVRAFRFVAAPGERTRASRPQGGWPGCGASLPDAEQRGTEDKGRHAPPLRFETRLGGGQVPTSLTIFVKPRVWGER